MAADILQFLKNKYVNDFEEAAEECGEFPLRNRFQEILDILQEIAISSSTPEEMKNLLYDLRFALAECRMLSEEREFRIQNKKSSFQWQFAKEFIFLCKTRRRLHQIKRKLRGRQHAREAEAEAENSSSLSSPIVRVPTYFPDIDETKIYGFNDQARKIESWFLDKNDDLGFNAIGIVGMGGSGKSTLAKMISQKLGKQQRFDLMIWVSLSENMNPEIIDSRITFVQKMLDSLTYMSSRPDDLSTLLHNLHHQLTGRKYLIVLDNVCLESDWYFSLRFELPVNDAHGFTHLSHGLPKGSGGAVIVTSRLEQVASKMVGEPNIFRVKALEDRDSWSIFTDSILKKTFARTGYTKFLRMKDDIVDKCDGLPLAAKTLAEIIAVQVCSPWWENSEQIKDIVLELDTCDNEDMKRAIQVAQKFPGVHNAFTLLHYRSLVVRGNCHPVQLANELGKFWFTELIDVKLDQL